MPTAMLEWIAEGPHHLQVGESYDICHDAAVFLHHFDESAGSRILAVGDNDENSAQVLTDNGYRVLGVDLRPHCRGGPISYFRLQGDFVELVSRKVLPEFDCIYSLSAIEHFGLGTYGTFERAPPNPNYDEVALQAMCSLLKSGGTAYLTVPYGQDYVSHGTDWRVYNHQAVRNRLTTGFAIEQEIFFKSAECNCPTTHEAGGIPFVAQRDADAYRDELPHLTVYLKLRKL